MTQALLWVHHSEPLQWKTFLSYSPKTGLAWGRTVASNEGRVVGEVDFIGRLNVLTGSARPAQVRRV